MMDTVLGADISHHNGAVDLGDAKFDGLSFVISKATQGTGYVDPTLYTNKDKAEAAGLLFGVYHFGTGDDVPTQVSHFLAAAEDVPLLVLDFEKNTSGGASMSLKQAEQFVQMIDAAKGRFPVLYTGSWLKDMHASSDILASCPLWLSQYGPVAKLPLGFDHWALWQYTDGHIGPHTIEGVGIVPHEVAGIGPCDLDLFAGTAEELAAFWQPVQGGG